MNDLIVDAGAAFERIAARPAPERFDVIVIGGGQAGLSVGYHLKQQGVRFVILDAHARVGDAWRKRWDSLRLFTQSWLDGLDGLRFPGPAGAMPTKDEMADYLEQYAAHFDLPVRNSSRVERLSKQAGRFVVRCGAVDGREQPELHADQVIVAMSGYQEKHVPALAAELRSDIVQLHSSDYRNAAQLAPGSVLVVGSGNSAAEIALELSRTHAVRMVGPKPDAVPVKMNRVLAFFLIRVFFHRILTISNAFGRKMRPTMVHKTTPLIRTKPKDLLAAGVELVVQRVASVREGLPALTDGRVVEATNVVWCTGYRASFPWIELPIFDAEREPQHEAGVVPSQPGLYFVGLPFLYSMSSSMVHGVGRDAKRIAGLVAAARAEQRVSVAQVSVA